MSTVMWWVLAILALGVLIVVHEAGHYLVARLFGMKVERFSIGFGPGILKWRRAGTLFQIAPIPFGGFVQITGMNPHEEYDEKDPHVYPNRPAILRFLTIFAGPFTNVAFSSVLIFFVFAFAGAPTGSGRDQVEAVVDNSAAVGQLEAGDVLIAADGVQLARHGDLVDHVQQSEGKPISLTILRDGKSVDVSIAPRKDEKGKWRIGVQLQDERQAIGLGVAALEAVKYPIIKSGQILEGLWQVAQRKAEAELTGPVGMTRYIRNQIEAGWMPAFEFLAMLNVYLGLFNLLPIPALDGGRLAFLTYELATRRRPNPKFEAAVHMAGMVVLLIILVLVTFKDFVKAGG